MCFLGFCNVYALRVNLSLAIVVMVNDTEAVSQPHKVGVCTFDKTLEFDSVILQWILQCTSVMTIMTTFIVVVIVCLVYYNYS